MLLDGLAGAAVRGCCTLCRQGCAIVVWQRAVCQSKRAPLPAPTELEEEARRKNRKHVLKHQVVFTLSPALMKFCLLKVSSLI